VLYYVIEHVRNGVKFDKETIVYIKKDI